MGNLVTKLKNVIVDHRSSFVEMKSLETFFSEETSKLKADLEVECSSVMQLKADLEVERAFVTKLKADLEIERASVTQLNADLEIERVYITQLKERNETSEGD
ncbi:hypothetical protein R1sor_023961 [Riccia sorocarpa]|uniref:Uncharacterized protein n=1 Tax=Riccia sorocarpa TaxID=122646 RepID=A0ABD3GSC4_9MARC